MNPGGDAFVTFAGFAVWLQREANRTAAAHSCDRVVTRAVTAAVVHRAGLCRETGTHSQTKTPRGKRRRRERLGPFRPSHRNGTHARWCYIKKGKRNGAPQQSAFIFQANSSEGQEAEQGSSSSVVLE